MTPEGRKYLAHMSGSLLKWVRQQVWPHFAEPCSAAEIAARLGVPKQKVANSCARLAEHGWLQIVGRDGRGPVYLHTGLEFPATQPSKAPSEPRLRQVQDAEAYWRRRLGPRAYENDPRDPPTGLLRRIHPPRDVVWTSSAGYASDEASFTVSR